MDWSEGGLRAWQGHRLLGHTAEPQEPSGEVDLPSTMDAQGSKGFCTDQQA